MKIDISQEEAIAVVYVLTNSWTPQEMQRIVYDFIYKLEAELEKSKGEKRE